MGFTKSTVTVIEAAGSTGTAGTMITGGSLQLTPMAGFSLRSADVVVGTLPTGIQSVVLSDTGTPYSAANKVNVAFTITPAYAMPSENTTLSIPVTGKAIQGVEAHVGYHIKMRQSRLDSRGNNNFTKAPLTTSTTDVDVESGGFYAADMLSDLDVTDCTAVAKGSTVYSTLNTVIRSNKASDVVNSFTGSVSVDTETTIGEYTVKCAEGYYFRAMPSLADTNANTSLPFFNKVFLRKKSQKFRKISGAAKRVTEVTYEVIYKNSSEVQEASCIDITVGTFVEKERDPTDNRLKVYMMLPKNKTVPVIGEKRVIKVLGDAGASFDFEVTSHLGVMIKKIHGAVIQVSKGGLGIYECEVTFPPTLTSVDWNVVIRPVGETILSTAVPSSVSAYTLLQAPPVTVSFTNTTSNGNIVTTLAPSITYTSPPDRFVESLGVYNKSIKFTTEVTWVLSASSGTYSITKAAPVISDFTNTAREYNGGTIVRMPSGFVATVADNIVTIKGKLELSYVGKTNVTIDMNLDNIVSLS